MVSDPSHSFLAKMTLYDSSYITCPERFINPYRLSLYTPANPGTRYVGQTTKPVPKDENLSPVKIVNITPAGAVIENSRHHIPELAKVTLDKYSNNKFKEQKLVTKAFKYTFPFYDNNHSFRAYSKIFDLIKKALLKSIPYVAEAKIPFISIPKESNGKIIVRLGPYANNDAAKVEMRYLRYITFLARKYSLPVLLSYRVFRWLYKPIGVTYTTPEDIAKNTYDVIEITASLYATEGAHGYLLLYYLENLVKVFETLHRKAHYASSTVRGS